MFKKINITDDQQLSMVQDSVAEEFKELPFNYPVLRGAFVEATIANVDTPVNHGLKRPLEGWLIVDRDANANVWRSSSVNLRPQDQIILIATASVNVRLYFF